MSAGTNSSDILPQDIPTTISHHFPRSTMSSSLYMLPGNQLYVVGLTLLWALLADGPRTRPERTYYLRGIVDLFCGIALGESSGHRWDAAPARCLCDNIVSPFSSSFQPIDSSGPRSKQAVLFADAVGRDGQGLLSVFCVSPIDPEPSWHNEVSVAAVSTRGYGVQRARAHSISGTVNRLWQSYGNFHAEPWSLGARRRSGVTTCV